MKNSVNEKRQAINGHYRKDEAEVVKELLGKVNFSDESRARIRAAAAQLVTTVRKNPSERTQLEDFMQRYSLSTPEGISLMCLAESLLRIPDSETANALILDKVGEADWLDETGEAEKWLTSVSSWGLMMSSTVLDAQNDSVFSGLVRRLGNPVIRTAMIQAMRMMGGHFVTGRDIDEALKNSKEFLAQGSTFSYDMLGEGARTAKDAQFYFTQYLNAIDGIGKSASGDTIAQRPGISVKLSALYPRYEYSKRATCVSILTANLLVLALKAKEYNIGLTVDAEEANRLELSFDIFEAVYTDPKLEDWDGFGLAVQAYQKRCSSVIDYLIELAKTHKKSIPIRLVKGAYWDTEIKHAQENGLSGYPVFTRKLSTDLSYVAVAQTMLNNRDILYPQFATHNAYTISAIIEEAGSDQTGFEFQRLHGMGQQLYQALYAQGCEVPCRIYAPVGRHQDLLPYLVRRLLENGANTSFVNQIHDTEIKVADLVDDPAEILRALDHIPHPKIPLPIDLYDDRKNSTAIDLTDDGDVGALLSSLKQYRDKQWQGVKGVRGEKRDITNPANPDHKVGTVQFASEDDADKAMQSAQSAFFDWNARSAESRAGVLEKLADAIEQNHDEFVALLVYEAGKTIPDAIVEIREAVDFCRYYAVEGRTNFSHGMHLPGPTGEDNRLYLTGRGVFVCISPWNFPLAIFVGQIVAALMAGNTVVAKPAEQTPLIASRLVQFFYDIGLPKNVFHLLPGGGDIGGVLVDHPLTAGVCFTGSTQTAQIIQKTLAAKKGAIVPLIAETGGQNAMIVDSSALAEQVVDDVIHSGFYSAGQRCSALRVLYVQDGLADKVIEMLQGAMAELTIGDPSDLITDIGPVIDAQALSRLQSHLDDLKAEKIGSVKTDDLTGTFCQPTALEIDNINQLNQENFGPIIHVIRFKQNDLDDVIAQINGTGYGLTLGIHSRIDHVVDYITARVRVGNIYVNRAMTGAVVGVQPFGGMGLSGTGPKAGGPHYLHRFATEKTVSINTTAAGGNAHLISLSDA